MEFVYPCCSKYTIFTSTQNSKLPPNQTKMVREYDTNTTADELVKDLAAEIKGKVILVTGVTQGTLGGFFVDFVSKASPARLILAGRSLANVEETAAVIKVAHPEIAISVLQIDFNSLAAVRRSAETVNGWKDVPHIDVLVNNAGIMATDFKLTEDGFEQQFGGNHLGPFLFTNLIINKILASKAPRVVNISSNGHRLNPIRFFDYNFRVRVSHRSPPGIWESFG